ncbi:MAG TPA: 2'-5' RNA ligase family protein [Acidimicrobiales bacterium]|nr:2'-5' RNA ligase family protein [Acidimicrobiales bacterium]
MAVWPDDSTLEGLASLSLGSTEGLRLVGPGTWHITLRFLGEVDDDVVPALAAALDSTAANMPGKIQCRVGPETAWFGDRVLHIPAQGLEDLATAVRAATIPVVPARTDRELRFNGHLTIARTKGHRLDTSARRALAGIPFAATFEVDSFDLVASEHSSDGRQYTPRATLLLRG